MQIFCQYQVATLGLAAKYMQAKPGYLTICGFFHHTPMTVDYDNVF